LCDHAPPRGAAIFNSFSFAAITRLDMPIIGRSVSRSDPSRSAAFACCAAIIFAFPSTARRAFAACSPVQREGIGVAAEWRDNEWHTLCHQAGDERDISRKRVQLCDTHGTLTASCVLQRSCELRPTVERVGAFPRFDLRVLRDNL
jgi:hypothetical protein